MCRVKLSGVSPDQLRTALAYSGLTLVGDEVLEMYEIKEVPPIVRKQGTRWDAMQAEVDRLRAGLSDMEQALRVLHAALK